MRIAGDHLYTVVVIKIKTGQALQQCPPCFLSKEFPPVCVCFPTIFKQISVNPCNPWLRNFIEGVTLRHLTSSLFPRKIIKNIEH